MPVIGNREAPFEPGKHRVMGRKTFPRTAEISINFSFEVRYCNIKYRLGKISKLLLSTNLNCSVDFVVMPIPYLTQCKSSQIFVYFIT